MKGWWQLCGSWVKRHRWAVAISLLVALSTIAAGVGLLVVAGWFLTAAFLVGSTLSFNFFAPSALVRGLSMWRIVSRYAERITGHRVTLALQAEIRAQTFAQLAQLPPQQLAQYQDGDLVARLINDVERLDAVYLLLVVPLVTALTAGGLYSLLLGIQMPWGGVVLFGALLVAAACVPFWVARRSSRLGQAAAHTAAQLRSLSHEMLAAQVDMVVFSAEAVFEQPFDALNQRLAQQHQRLSDWASFGQLLQQLCTSIVVGALLLIGILTVTTQALSGPVWVGLLFGALGVFELLAPLTRGATALGMASAAAQRLSSTASAKLVDEASYKTKAAEPRRTAQKAAVARSIESVSALNASPQVGRLQAQNLQVGYDAAFPVLIPLSFDVAAGERVLISGPSGIGKSTLLHTLLGIQPALSGQLSYQGQSLESMALAERLQHFALLSQHSTVFLGTIAFNLTLGQTQFSDDQLWEALTRAQLADFVRTLPHGLHSWVGEAGHSLSTGQARRLCLARLLLHPAVVWLLDEPTSGLDASTAQALLHDVLVAAGNRTVLWVTHEAVPLALFSQHWSLTAPTG